MRRRSHPEHAQNDEKDDLEEVPVSIIGNLEQYEFACPERIHRLYDRISKGTQRLFQANTYSKGHCRNKSTKERAPHGLNRKRMAHLFNREEHTADRSTECNSDTSGTGCCENLPSFAYSRILVRLPLAYMEDNAPTDLDSARNAGKGWL
jgi:hypothetical protein